MGADDGCQRAWSDEPWRPGIQLRLGGRIFLESGFGRVHRAGHDVAGKTKTEPGPDSGDADDRSWQADPKDCPAYPQSEPPVVAHTLRSLAARGSESGRIGDPTSPNGRDACPPPPEAATTSETGLSSAVQLKCVRTGEQRRRPMSSIGS